MAVPVRQLDLSVSDTTTRPEQLEQSEEVQGDENGVEQASQELFPALKLVPPLLQVSPLLLELITPLTQ